MADLWKSLATAFTLGLTAVALSSRPGNPPSFWESLRADGPRPEHAEKLMLYGQLVGSWEGDVFDYESDGTRRASRGEWHFGWVLEGRAIQDVFIVPPRSTRAGGVPAGQRNTYGATLRVYDPKSDTWSITWVSAVSGVRNTLVGRKQGEDIVQEGTDEDGNPIRWIFSDITPDSFRWRGEVSHDQGKTWSKEAEFFLRRSGG
ncbi:MAG: hypothetical protein ACRD24_01480 [Terriglobales bacterium]